jgi:hypothetical protein
MDPACPLPGVEAAEVADLGHFLTFGCPVPHPPVRTVGGRKSGTGPPGPHPEEHTMDRRKAVAIAGTVGVTVVAASAAAFANISLLSGAGATDGVGELDAQNVAGLVEEVPTSTTVEDLLVSSPESTVVYVDEYVTAPGGPTPVPSGAPSSGVTAQADGTTGDVIVPAPPVAGTVADPAYPVGGYDDEYEDDGYEDHDDDDEDDEHEAEDDDHDEYEDDDD